MKSPGAIEAAGVVAGGLVAYLALRFLNQLFAIVPVEPRSEPLTLPTTKQSFVAQMRAAITAAWPTLSAETVTLMVAQAAYESGYGKAVAYRLANNPWNVVHGAGVDYGGYPAASRLAPVPGPDRDANNQPITQQWRHFANYAQAAKDWLGMLKVLWPSAYAKLVAGDATYVTDLGSGTRKYYGLKPEVYQAQYNGVLVQVRTA